MHGFIFASYQRAIEIDPDGEVAHTNLGFAYQAQGHLDKAIALHKRAIELDPNYADAHSNLGIAHSEQGHLDMAIASYKRAIDIDQDGADAHGNLMNAHKAKADALEAEGGDPRKWVSSCAAPPATGRSRTASSARPWSLPGRRPPSSRS